LVPAPHPSQLTNRVARIDPVKDKLLRQLHRLGHPNRHPHRIPPHRTNP